MTKVHYEPIALLPSTWKKDLIQAERELLLICLKTQTKVYTKVYGHVPIHDSYAYVFQEDPKKRRHAASKRVP